MKMSKLEKVIQGLKCCFSDGMNCDSCPYNDLCGYRPREEGILADALDLLKEQEDIGTELTNAMELIHKKNERIKKLEEQIETLTRWRANAGAFD